MVYADIPTILAIEEMIRILSILIIVEIKCFFNLGIHPKGECQKHKD